MTSLKMMKTKRPFILLANETAASIDLICKNEPWMLCMDDCYPIHMATESHRHDVLDVLLKNGINPNRYRERDRSYPIYLACHINCETCVELLLNSGADPNVQNNTGLTPLAVTENLKILKLLINHGANPNIMDAYGNTQTRNLINNCSKLALELFKIYPNIIKEDKNRLFKFCKTAEDVEMLVKSGADPDSLNDLHRPLSFYISYVDDNFKLIEALLKCGANPNFFYTLGNQYTPLLYATVKKNFEVVKLLLRYGAFIFIAEPFDVNPITFAIAYECADLIRIFIQHVDAQTFTFAFHLCVSRKIKSNDILELIATHIKANTLLNDDYLIHDCAKFDQIPILKVLGPKFHNSKNVHGNTALHYCTENNIDCLLEFCDVNAQNYAGETILHFLDLSTEMIHKLLKNGARPSIRTKYNLTAFDVHPEVLRQESNFYAFIRHCSTSNRLNTDIIYYIMRFVCVPFTI